MDTHEIGAIIFLLAWLALVAFGLWRERREAKQCARDLSTLRTGYGRSAFKAHGRFDT